MFLWWFFGNLWVNSRSLGGGSEGLDNSEEKYSSKCISQNETNVNDSLLNIWAKIKLKLLVIFYRYINCLGTRKEYSK